MKTLLLVGLLAGSLAAATAVSTAPAHSQGMAAVKKHHAQDQKSARSEKQSAHPDAMYYPPPPDGVPDTHIDPWRDVHAPPAAAAGSK